MKSKQIRELQVSSSQLALIFLALLGVAVIIFLLGVSIGKKYGEAQLEAAREKITALSEAGTLAEKTSMEKKAESAPEAEKIAPPSKPVQMEKTEPEQMKLTESLPVKKAEKSDSPAPAKITPEAKLARPEARVFYVQIAAFSRKEASASIIRELKKAGYQPLVLDPFPDDKKPLYRVRIGPFKSEAEAEAARNRVRTLIPEASRAFLVR